MIKICSLEFVNKETFEADIMTADGKVLFYATDVITPEKILKLYFKDIYIATPLTYKLPKSNELTKENLIKEVGLINSTEDVGNPEKIPVAPSFEIGDENETGEKAPITSNLETLDNDDETKVKTLAQIQIASTEEIIEAKHDDSNDLIEFNEDEAKRVTNLALIIGKELQLTEDRLKELEQAAYYHNIGVTKFKKKDLSEKDFRQKQAIAGYEILKNEKKLPESIAETAKYCVENYKGFTLKLNNEIPCYDIVAIASYYDRLINHGFTKNDALAKMLRLGGNKFNIHILHKFNNIMKDING